MRVIGIAGKAGSGKNTVAGILAGLLVEQGFTVAVDAFAVDVKRHARMYFGWDGRKDDAGRALLQRVGAERRKATLDFWIECLAWRHNIAAVYQPGFLILSDVRYENEMAWCADRGVVWFVTGRGGLTGAKAEHESETAITEENEQRYGEVTIENDGTLEMLVPRVWIEVEAKHHLRPADR